MTAKLNAGTIANVPASERYAIVRYYMHRVCEVTWRRGKFADWQTDTFRVIGASHHATNGNSTGDLIVAPAEDGAVFTVDGVPAPLLSIALANLKRLEVAR